MDRKLLRNLFLRFLAVMCLSVTCLHRCLLNTCFRNSNFDNMLYFEGDWFYEEYWFVVSGFARILGVVLLAKYAVKVGFSKCVRTISILCVIVTLAFLVLFYDKENFLESFQHIYIFRFFYRFLQPTMFIFSCVYLFKSFPKQKHVLVSAFLVTAICLGDLISHHLRYFSINNVTMFCAIPFFAACAALMINLYLERDADSSKEHFLKAGVLELNTKMLCAFLGAAYFSMLYFNPQYLRKSLINAVVVDSGFYMGGTLYFTVFLAALIPGAYLSKRYGHYQMTILALSAIAGLMLLPPFLCANYHFYVVHQLMFSVFSAIFVGPLFALLYHIPQQQSFKKLAYFFTGYSTCHLLVFSQAKLTHLYGIFGVDWSIYCLSIFACLFGVAANKKFFTSSYRENQEKSRLVASA